MNIAKYQDRDRHGCGHDKTCDENLDHTRRNQYHHGCTHDDTYNEDHDHGRRDHDGCSYDEVRDHERID